MFFDGLTRMSPKEKIEMGIAESVDISPDGRIYTFHLRDAFWTNGAPVTAHDFVYAWKKVLDPNFPASQAFQLYVVKGAKEVKEGKSDEIGVKAIDDKTLVVELENPTPYFLELVSLPVYFPVLESVDVDPQWSTQVPSYVSNGPFSLKEWKHNNEIVGEKNEEYWDKSHVKLSSVKLIMVSQETELKMYEMKELDWAGSPISTLPVDALNVLRSKGRLHSKPFLATYFFRTNTEKPPFNHPLVRKALALAINRQEIVSHVTQGGQEPATGLVPVSMNVQSHPYFQDGDLKEAKACIEQALTDMGGVMPTVKLMYVASERNHLIAQAVQQQWRNALGLDVELEALEKKVYFDRISRLDFQMAAGSWTADFNDPLSFLDIFKYKKSGSNNTAWESAEYANLLNEAKKTIDPVARLTLLHKAEEILVNAMPIIPLFHYTLLYVSNDDVKDVAVSNLGHVDFKWAYIAKGDL
jgi:oligopeptide transport system substrate-binding protein